MKIACLQTDIIWENKNENFDKVERLISEAVKQGCDCVCLPELFATGFTMNSDTLAEEVPGTTSNFLMHQAKKNGICIIGTLAEKGTQKEKPKNVCIVINQTGELIFKYNKIHLFTLDREDVHYSKGSSLSTFYIGETRAAIFICYDLRFPELFSTAAEKGVKVIFVPANWPSMRKEHWKLLLIARAIENQVYVVGVNRAGKSPSYDYHGNSMIINPLGKIIAEGTNSEEIVFGDVKAEEVDNIRKDLPFFKDRRTELYGLLGK